MHRKKSLSEQLLKFNPESRKQYILTLTENEVNHYIHQIEKELQNKNYTFIDLSPTVRKNYESGFISFPNYHGQISILHDTVIENLLTELKEHRENLNIEWKRLVTQYLPTNKKNSEDKTFELENSKLKTDLRNAYDKIQALVEQKEEFILSYEKIKINQDEVLRKTMEENDYLIKENEVLKQILDGKHDKQSQMSTETLKNIVEKYEKKKFSFFSHTPKLISNLKQLLGPEMVSKAEVRSCLDDPDNLFDATPSFAARNRLTNRGRLICELSDAFDQQIGLKDFESKVHKLMM